MTNRKHHDDRSQAEQLLHELEVLRSQVLSELHDGQARCTVYGFDPAAATAIQLIVRGEADEALTGAMPVLVDRVTGAMRSELKPLLITNTPSQEPAMSVPPEEDDTTTTDESAEIDETSAETGDEDKEDADTDEGEEEQDDQEPEDSAEEEDEEEEEEDDDEEDDDEEDDDDEDDEPSDEDEDDEDEDEDEDTDDEDEDDDDDEDDEEEEEDIDDLRAEVARLRKLLDAGGKGCLTRNEAEVLIGQLREDLADDEDEDLVDDEDEDLADDEDEDLAEDEDDDDDIEVVARRRDRRVPRRTYRKLAQGLHTVLTAAVKPVRFSLGEFTLRR